MSFNGQHGHKFQRGKRAQNPYYMQPAYQCPLIDFQNQNSKSENNYMICAMLQLREGQRDAQQIADVLFGRLSNYAYYTTYKNKYNIT